jgi:hypothetical protein
VVLAGQAAVGYAGVFLSIQFFSKIKIELVSRSTRSQFGSTPSRAFNCRRAILK